ncbi:aminoglycoside phosphotransferase family protein [Pseudactinotalea suaedae]|uniref:aminoglycoside phosphotransferase family protein n=1 Tax=Pseudactinotalea suaedae TaxID=1524924 RepID=UPI0012E325F3|nr:aminoglycoside phosphotransferase family protein [Pseudactinotalea suaedae]
MDASPRPDRTDLPRAVTDLVPPGLIDAVHGHVPAPGFASGDTWLITAPGLVDELTELWTLTVTGPATYGNTSLVLPVTSPQGPAVLKLAWPHPELREEHRALTLWGGRGAVRLLAADPSRSALLLERLEPRDLGGPPVSVLDSCEEIGRVAATLDRPAPAWLRQRASEHLRTLAADIDALRTGPHSHALPRRLLERGRSLALDLAAEPDIDARLVHADLHQHNVLWRPDPGEWVAIDPHATAADPTWVVAPALWNRWEDAVAAYDTRVHLNVRLDVVCEAAGLDVDRGRVVSELRILRNAVGDVRAQPPDLAAALTRHVTILKALQPG